jgi:hypothetical protein
MRVMILLLQLEVQLFQQLGPALLVLSNGSYDDGLNPSRAIFLLSHFGVESPVLGIYSDSSICIYISPSSMLIREREQR